MEQAGVFMHHDCVTGTAKRKVDEDYFNRINTITRKFTDLLFSKLSFEEYSMELTDGLNQEWDEENEQLFMNIFSPSTTTR